jgi:flagellar biosynthetic protein FliP
MAILAVVLFAVVLPGTVSAQQAGGPLPTGIRIQFDQDSTPAEVSQSLQIVLLLTVLSLAPAIVVMTTSFTRILVVFGFLRRALGTQQVPSAQIMTGLSLFLTIFIMGPIWKGINEDAVKPYMDNQITQAQAWDRGVAHMRTFMASQTGKAELGLFLELANEDQASKIEDVGMQILMPAFMVSELKTAFQLGFLLYLPFLVIDLVTATILMSLGMMMLPPMMISLPIKLLFFVLADGWNLFIRGLVSSFQGFS